MKKILLAVMFTTLFAVFVSKVYAGSFYHHEARCDVGDCPRRNNQVNDIQNNVDDVANEVEYYDCGNPNCHRTDEHTHHYETNEHHRYGNEHSHSHGRNHR